MMRGSSDFEYQLFQPDTLIPNQYWETLRRKDGFMEFFCRHCEKAATGSTYRVLSVEDGIVMLDMVVCRSCYDQARQLGLDGEEISVQMDPLPISQP